MRPKAGRRKIQKVGSPGLGARRAQARSSGPGQRSGDGRERFVAAEDGGDELVSIIGAEARIRLDHRNERPMAVPLLADQAAGASRAGVIFPTVARQLHSKKRGAGALAWAP
jgi:hypothetical protein